MILKFYPCLFTFRKTSLLLSCLLLIHVSQVDAQCCSNGVNLLSTYNPNFSDTFSTIPHGFTNDNTYSSSAGAGYYTMDAI